MTTVKAFTLLIFFGIFFYIVYVLSQSSIQYDNAQTLWIASHSLPVIVKLSTTMSAGPLYYLLVNLWVTLFGSNLLSLRFLSMVFFIFSVIELYNLARDLGSKTFAFTTNILFALSPLIIYYSFSGGIYMTIIFFTIINHASFLKMISSNARNSKIAYITSMLLGLYTHYVFILLLMSQLLYLIIKSLIRRTSNQPEIYEPEEAAEKIQVRGQAGRIILTYITILLLYLPLILYTHAVGGLVLPSAAPLSQSSFVQTFFNFFIGYQSPEAARFIVAFWPLLGMLIFFVFTRGRKISIRELDYFLIVTFVPLIALFSLSFITAAFEPQYLIFIAPGIFLLLSLSLLRGSTSFPFSLIPLVSIIMFLFLVMQTLLPGSPARADFESLSKDLTQEATFSDIIVVNPPTAVYPVQFYYTGAARVSTIPDWDYLSGGRIPQYSHKNTVAAITAYKENYQYLYYIETSIAQNSSGQDSKYYLDTHFEKVMQKTYGSQLILTKYRLRY